MADKLVTLQDENKTPIYPESRASVVKTENGTTVEEALKQKQPSGNYATKEELSNYATTEALTQGLRGKADSTAIPTKLSQLTNDSNYLTDAPSDGKQYGRKNNEWSVIEAGSSTHTLDLSPLYDEVGSPVATVSEEFLLDVKKAYNEKYSNCILMGYNLPMTLQTSDDFSIIDIISFSQEDKKVTFAAIHIFINNSDRSLSFTASPVDFDQSGSGTKALTDNGQYAEFAKPTKVESGGSGTVTKQLNPNTFYKFGEVASLTITLAAESAGLENEYKFEFVSGSTPATLLLPDSIKWKDGVTPTMEASKTYQVSIVNNLAIYAAF